MRLDQLGNMDYMSVLGNLNAEPKRTYLWQLKIGGIPAYLMRKAKRPNVTFKDQKVDYLNTYRYYAGKAEWQPMQIELNDPIVPSAAQMVMEWVRLQYQTATGRAGYAAVYKKNLTLDMLGPAGTTVQSWDLKGAFMTAINFHELDYSNQSELAFISATLRYDAAILKF